MLFIVEGRIVERWSIKLEVIMMILEIVFWIFYEVVFNIFVEGGSF